MSGMNRKHGTSIGVAALCTAVMMTTGAFAGTTTDSVSVRYVTADLATPAGAEHLYHRIRRAARLACHEPGRRELTEYRLYQECFAEAVESAVSKVNSSELTALHRSKMHTAAG